MKTKFIRRIFLPLLLVLGANGIAAGQDFSVADREGNNYYFNVIDSQNNYVELTFAGKASKPDVYAYRGDLTIPVKVKHDGTVYTVKSIGPKAFAGAVELTGVTIPASVDYICEFAFDNCTKLSKIIFPGSQVEIMKGAFFRCSSLKNITLGSDWKTIDLEIFKWSKSLREIRIPAKVTKISNVKSLPCLAKIDVDDNNPNFASVSGVLYNKDKTILYACPLAYSGTLYVCEGTVEIYNGALNDCARLSGVVFPKSLTSVSYQVLSRAVSLVSVRFMANSVVKTAEINGAKYFALINPNAASVKIEVPAPLKKLYKSAMKYPGYNFSEIDGGVTKKIYSEQLVLVKNVKGIK